MTTMTQILFVCLGNICRSAAAEAIAQKIINEKKLDIKVDSAGTARYHEGETADPRMIAHCQRKGYEITSISRPVQYDDFDRFDLIIAMDDSNRQHLYQMAPSIEAARKISTMASYLLKHPDHDHIPDPYYGGAKGFDLVIELLEDSISNLLTSVNTH